MNWRLYIWQRLTAAVMAPLVIIHLAVIIYAIQDGLTAQEILGRTRGSVLWGGFYTLFVMAATVHAGIGLRTVLSEWTGLNGRACDLLALAAAVLLCGLGLRAVYAVVS